MIKVIDSLIVIKDLNCYVVVLMFLPEIMTIFAVRTWSQLHTGCTNKKQSLRKNAVF